jgi:hypothetical protein
MAFTQESNEALSDEKKVLTANVNADNETQSTATKNTNGKAENGTEPEDTKDSSTSKKEDEPVLPTGSVTKVKLLQERYNKDGDQETVEVDELNVHRGADAQFAAVVRQVYTKENKLESTRMTVSSPHILKAFREVVGSYPTLPVNFTQPFDMEAPFHVLHHYWDEFDAYRLELTEDEPRSHLDVLLDFMTKGLGKERQVMQAMLAKQQINFEHFWYLYRPGDLIVTYLKGRPWLMEATRTFYEEDAKCGKFMRVDATHTDYDGTNVGMTKHSFKMTQRAVFGQANPTNIRDLPVYPWKFADADDELEKSIIDRGERFIHSCGVSIKHYSGLADYLKNAPPSYWHPEMDEFDPVWLPYTESGRIVVDRKTFQEDHYNGSHVAKKVGLTDRDRLLCPPFVYGFSVSRKEWCRFYIDSISETAWKDDAFKSLILPQKQLNIVNALVSSHRFPDDARNESEQKGKGLVTLLHGPPGSGKTLTAECAAEETQRALFSTSMSELNRYNDAYWFEIELKRVLRLATIWKAVVLFDEADVFLEARGDKTSTGDAAARNALVAVFLRHLEYFSGIVFLTTNRIHVFDAAMKSRVHLALGYSAPDMDSRRLIWTHTFSKLPEDERGHELEAAVEGLSRTSLNGREISNIVTTARTLARFEKVPLSPAHIENVLGVRMEFEENLVKARAVENAKQSTIVESGSILAEEGQQSSNYESSI